MKYSVLITEHGYGCCTKPEHHFGAKQSYYEFDNRSEALKKVRDEMVKLYDKYDICKKWHVMEDTHELTWIKTDYENIDGWYHEFEILVISITNEE